MGVKVTVFANGKARQVESDQTVEEMVRQMKLAPSSVLERRVEHGDRLEFVKVVAGG